MKKRTMLTKVAALSMAGLLTLTGLPVAGLDGALAIEAAVGNLSTSYVVGSEISGLTVTQSGSQVVADDYQDTTSPDPLSVTVTPANASKILVPVAAGEMEITATKSGGVPEVGKATIAKKGLETADVTAVLSYGKSGGTAKLTDENSIDLEYDAKGYTVELVGFKVDFGNGITEVIEAGGATIAKEGVTDKASYPAEDTTNFELKVDNKNAGSALMTNKGTYNIYLQATAAAKGFTGSAKVCTITIDDADVSDDSKSYISIQSGATTVEYTPHPDGAKFNDNQIAVYIDNAVVDPSEYSLGYEDNTSVGDDSATVYATSNKGAWSGRIEKSFSVTAKELVDSTAAGDIVVEPLGWTVGGDFGYTGQAIEPKVLVYDTEYNYNENDKAYEDESLAVKKGGKWYPLLKEGDDYDIEYVNNSAASNNASIIIKGTNNYRGSITKNFQIKESKYDVNEAITDITMKVGKQAVSATDGIDYTGNDIVPVVEATLTNPTNSKTTTLKFSGAITNGVYGSSSDATNFYATIENNKDAGEATVSIVGKSGQYGGTISTTFTINPAELDDDFIASSYKEKDGKAVSGTKQTYDGTEKTFDDSKLVNILPKLEKGTDYTVQYSNNINAGKATATFVGTGNYTGTVSLDYTIEPLQVTSTAFSPDVEDIINQVYTGSEVTPKITATWVNGAGKKTALVEGTDYTLEYKNNIGDASKTKEAQVNLVGMGNFTKTKSKVATFRIVPAANSLANATVTLREPSVAYDGKYHTASIASVRLAGADTDLEAKNYKQKATVTEVNAGEYTVTVVGVAGGDYGGEATATFTITPQEVSGATVTLDGKKSFTYDGKKKSVKVATVTLDGTNEAPADSYTVKGLSATAAGKKTVTVTFNGNYSGTAKTTWNIAKAAQPLKVSPASKSYKVKAVKKKAQSFTIKATKNQGKVTYKSSSKKVTVSSKGKVTVKKGTKKGTYKITVKAAGNTNYKAGSKTVTVTVK
jgi:hypothetical protein